MRGSSSTMYSSQASFTCHRHTYRTAYQAVHYKRFNDVYLSAHRLALIIEDSTQSGKLLVRVKRLPVSELVSQ